MIRSVAAVGAVGAAAAFYGTVIERNAFTLRRFDVPVLPAGADPVRVLHVSDLHITANQRNKHDWVRSLAHLQPDLVVNTGDTLSAENAIPAVMRSLEPLFEFPGVFVPGNNDYYVPRPKNPIRYFGPNRVDNLSGRRRMPWGELAAAMAGRGWLDLTHVRTSVQVAGAPVALAGTD